MKEGLFERKFIFHLERLSDIKRSTYLFVQQLFTSKLLDLDNDEYPKNSHRYRTRVDANAAALELLGLSCDDEIGRYESLPFLFSNFFRKDHQIPNKNLLSMYFNISER